MADPTPTSTTTTPGEAPITQAYIDNLKANYMNERGGGDMHQQLSAIQDFSQIFGRNPTAGELAMLSPGYAGDPNTGNTPQGKALVAKYYESQVNTPENLAAKQQAQYTADAPKYYDQVNTTFNSLLGRNATDDEKSHFGALMATGTVDPYSLQSFIQAQPEYQTNQNKTFQNSLATQLQGYDKEYLNNSVLPSLQEAYAKQGRSFDSSSFQGALANAANQQNTTRENFLAGLTAQQYGNTSANAYNAYAGQIANQQALSNAGVNSQYSGIQNTFGRSQDITDYMTQANAYNQYLARNGQRSQMQGALGGAASGASAGAAFGPYGAAIGGVVGGIGGYFGSKGSY